MTKNVPSDRSEQSYQTELGLEKKHAENAVTKIRSLRQRLETSLKYMGEENLSRLKELREDAEANPTDLFMFIEQLHSKNQAFNFKDKIARLEELTYTSDEPYFSRIDLYNTEKDANNKIYIGKFGVSDPDPAKKPLIVDWRAKIASVYYRYRYPQKNVSYKTEDGENTRDLTLKRTFEFDKGDLLKFYNNDLQLDEKDIINTKISKRTGGVLEDIVATIQQSQMDIIEYDPRGVCIVQGCVGSGKSTVAIHKLSHIFFNYPDLIRPQNSFLLAKNQILVGYLSTLFPKLGIFDLNYGTLKDLIVKLTFAHELKITFDLSDETGLDEADNRYIKNLQSTAEQLRKKVEDDMDALERNEIYSSYLTFVYDNELSAMENINLAIDDLEEEAKYQKDKLESGVGGAAEARCFENIRHLRNLIREIRKISNQIKTVVFPSFLKEFGIGPAKTMRYTDVIKYLYLYSNVYGLPNFRKYEYCVVDEGQDFSLLEYLLINKLVMKGRFCILGDLNQSYTEAGLTNWKDIDLVITDAKQCKKFELITNYRSTKPIIDFACKILSRYKTRFLLNSINRRGEEVVEIPAGKYNKIEKLMELLSKDLEPLDKSVGIICHDVQEFEVLQRELSKKFSSKLKERFVVLNPKERILYTPKGLYLTLFDNCKGLEFAKVYVLGTSRKPKNFLEAKRHYIAATRAMNELVVFYS